MYTAYQCILETGDREMKRFALKFVGTLVENQAMRLIIQCNKCYTGGLFCASTVKVWKNLVLPVNIDWRAEA